MRNKKDDDFEKRMKEKLSSKHTYAFLKLIIYGGSVIFLLNLIITNIERNVLISIFYILIGAVWSWEINRAWQENKQYNKSFQPDP